MHVSVTRTKGSPDQSPDLATIAGEEMLPWLSQIEGFEGLLMLSDDANAPRWRSRSGGIARWPNGINRHDASSVSASRRR